MRPIATTVLLILGTIAAIIATVVTGSLQAAGALALVGLLASVWVIRVDAWPLVVSVWREFAKQKETW